MELKNPSNHRHGDAACADLPDLKRLNYFYGQMLGVNDFRTEQAFFREKLKLHNRCLHGHGTVCGLKVVPLPPAQECKSDSDLARQKLQAELDAVSAKLEVARKTGDKSTIETLQASTEKIRGQLQDLPPAGCDATVPARVVIECGLALDCEGNEIIVPRPYDFDPWHLLSDDDRKRVPDGQGTDLYLSICYCEQPVDPVRPVMPNACGATPECNHGKLRDAFKLRLTVDAPPRDTCCDSCCSCCEEPCLLLAVLRGYRKGSAATAIDNSVRRLVETSAYPATTITGISWTHGATYSWSDAGEIIGLPEGTAGIQINFSRPVLTSTLTDGVVDLWVIEGGSTKHAGVYYLEGEFEAFGAAETVESFRFRYIGDENLDHGDRVMVTIRCAFILDECCRPVDGTHVGGRVPLIAEFNKFDHSTPHPRCDIKPPGYGPWTSGAGTPGSSFESWFYIEKAKVGEKRRSSQEYTK